MLSQLAQLAPTFARLGVNVAAVTLGKPAEAKLFCAQRSSDLNCLSDPHQLAYSTYGIGRMNLLTNWLHPQTWMGYVRTWRAGFRARLTDTDMLRLSATFVIDTQGVVRFAHYNRFTSDHPDWGQVQTATKQVSNE